MEENQKPSISEEQIREKIEEMGGFEELAQKEEFFKCERAWWELPMNALKSVENPSQEVKTALEVCIAVLEFSSGNLGYQPKDFTARILSKNIHRVIKASLEARVKQKAKNALAGKASAEKRKNASAEESQYKPAQEYIPLQESAREDTSQHVLPQEYTPQQESARANHTTITEQNRTEQNRTEPFVGSSSKDSKGMGEEEKSPYFVQQSQQAAGQPQQPHQLQGMQVERTQPSLATPQQQAATQAKFPVGQQSQLSLRVPETIELMTDNGGDTFLNAFPVIKNSDIQKTLAALYFLTDKSQSEVSEITGLIDEVVNTGARKEENILKEVFGMAIDASNGCLFDDRNGCRETADKIKNHLKGLLAKPQSGTRIYIDPNEKLPF